MVKQIEVRPSKECVEKQTFFPIARIFSVNEIFDRTDAFLGKHTKLQYTGITQKEQQADEKLRIKKIEK